MKINAALAKSLLMAASVGIVTPVFAKTPAKDGSASAKQEATAKPEDKEPEATIPGTSHERPNGGFIGITADPTNGFTISFYDKDKKQIPCDVARASARWKPNYKIGEERRIFNPSGDGQTLTAPAPRPPYNFKLFLTLLSEDGAVVENYALDFRD